ncbi:MAG TPA: response regulator [Verrucomicrobiae bacterium]|nr:response regulator [Verrucomicrobiae bacterium]
MTIESNPSAASATSKSSRRPPEKILLVDDEPAIRQMLTRLLTAEGYHVLPAGNGIEALEFAGHTDFNLILLDLNMPGLDGWDTYEQISSRNPLVPVIIITARPNQRFIALAAGTGALMEKPLDLEKLFQTIRHLLDEPPEVRLARLSGRPAEFQYVPPAGREIGKSKRRGKIL